MEAVVEYLSAISDISPQSTEHEKRGALDNLFRAFAPNGITVKHEPNRDKSEKKAGSPDFLILRDSLSLGYVENKRVNADLDSIVMSEQIAKYLTLSDNILLTDYLRFCLIRPDPSGKASIIKETRICSLNELPTTPNSVKKSSSKLDIKQVSENLSEIFELFYTHEPKPISTSIQFANSLALRTRFLRDILYESKSHHKISEIYETFKKALYRDLGYYDFSDSFAQTLTYSLFLAKLNCADGKEIDLYNAKKFIPHSFPLIRSLSGFLENLDDLKDIEWLLEEILNITNHIDVASIIKELNQIGQKDEFGVLHKDPYLHFYETFLAQYDPKLREVRGVYYTPAAVVDFIINAIDEVLKNDFGESKGLGMALKKDSQITLLDFATGTGTFLLEAFRKALDSESKNSAYFNPANLIEKFKGFEYLIAPYVIAHLKLSQTLKEEFDYKVGERDDEERLKIYLTNTLNIDEIAADVNSPTQLFAEFELAKESKTAQQVKNDPILIITGNPPYNSSSMNTYEKVRDYYDFGVDKKGKAIKEKNANSLQDDYVKFIRFAQSKIESQESGIIGIITNHGFLDNVTFRGMRKHLLNAFDKIYLLDLHGNAKRKEKSPDGSVDQNVFDIQQGVSISIFIKNKSNKSTEKEVYHQDLFGKRNDKYNFLYENTISSVKWNRLNPKEPFYLFVPQDESLKTEYEEGWGVKDIFRLNGGVGICSHRDKIVYHNSKKELLELLNDFATKSEQELYAKYDIGEDSRDWRLKPAMDVVKENFDDLDRHIMQCHYRPFDFRWTFYNSKIKTFIAYPVYDVFEHFLQDQSRDVKNEEKDFDKKSPKDKSHLFEDDKDFESDLFGDEDRIENFTPEFREYVDKKYGEHFSPEVILGYIYAVLFHKGYREKYVDFLKNDFPKIPFSDSKEKFLRLSNLGQELISLHLSGGGGAI